MKRFILFLALTFSISAFAGEREASGTVQISASTGYLIIILSSNNSGCGNRYFFKPDSDYNRAMFSMLLAAQMSGKKVWVNGSGECLAEYPFNNAYQLVNMSIIAQ